MKPALTVILAALAALLTPPGRAAAEPRPNVLLVVVDDLRFDDFGAAGHPFQLSLPPEPGQPRPHVAGPHPVSLARSPSVATLTPPCSFPDDSALPSWP